MTDALIRKLLERAGDLMAAIDGTTDQFEDEVSRLAAAVRAVEKTLPEALASNQFGLRCPACGRDDEIDIAATVWVRLCEDGTDITAAHCGDHEWDLRSPACCAACGHRARAVSFTHEESTVK